MGLLGSSAISDFLREAYRPGETFGSAFARLSRSLFADWGVILLDAADAELHQIAEPVYRAAIERAEELDEALLSAARCWKRRAIISRSRLRRRRRCYSLYEMEPGYQCIDGSTGNGSTDFLIEEERISQVELLSRISSSPQDFSANVLLRPVIQDYLLPTVAYTGGSAEVAYFAQVAVVYEALLGKVTPVVPRFSATVVEAKPKGLLERYGLRLPDLFQGPEALREQMATRTLPKELQSAFDHAEGSLEKSLATIREASGPAGFDPSGFGHQCGIQDAAPAHSTTR